MLPVVYFPENSGNIELLKVPQIYDAQSGYYLILHGTYLVKIIASNGVLPGVDFPVPKIANFLGY
jgi:hypothetical protein